MLGCLRRFKEAGSVDVKNNNSCSMDSAAAPNQTVNYWGAEAVLLGPSQQQKIIREEPVLFLPPTFSLPPGIPWQSRDVVAEASSAL